MIYGGELFEVRFEHAKLYFDIEAAGISLEQLEKLLSSILSAHCGSAEAAQ